MDSNSNEFPSKTPNESFPSLTLVAVAHAGHRVSTDVFGFVVKATVPTISNPNCSGESISPRNGKDQEESGNSGGGHDPSRKTVRTLSPLTRSRSLRWPESPASPAGSQHPARGLAEETTQSPASPAVPERAVPVAADKSGHSLTARHWAHRPGGPTAGAWGEEGQSPATSEPAVCGPTSGRGLRETCPARAPRTSEADQCCGPRCEFTCTATHKQDGGESRSSHTRARPPVADCSPGKPCCLQEKAAGLC